MNKKILTRITVSEQEIKDAFGITGRIEHIFYPITGRKAEMDVESEAEHV